MYVLAGVHALRVHLGRKLLPPKRVSDTSAKQPEVLTVRLIAAAVKLPRRTAMKGSAPTRVL